MGCSSSGNFGAIDEHCRGCWKWEKFQRQSTQKLQITDPWLSCSFVTAISRNCQWRRDSRRNGRLVGHLPRCFAAVVTCHDSQQRKARLVALVYTWSCLLLLVRDTRHLALHAVLVVDTLSRRPLEGWNYHCLSTDLGLWIRRMTIISSLGRLTTFLNRIPLIRLRSSLFFGVKRLPRWWLSDISIRIFLQKLLYRNMKFSASSGERGRRFAGEYSRRKTHIVGELFHLRVRSNLCANVTNNIRG